MKYFSSTDPQIQVLGQNVLFESHLFAKAVTPVAAGVFLAHSSADEKTLPLAIGLLEKHGAKVYVDKIDHELPKKTSAETGEKLKERITQCPKFVVYVTANSKDSRWVPWELGIADEKKKLANVALLPDVGNQTNVDWPEQEYLGLYPRIVFATFDGQDKPVWMVLEHHTNEGTELSAWLERPN